MRARTLAALLTTVALALTGTVASPAALALPSVAATHSAFAAIPGPAETQLVSVSSSDPAQGGDAPSGDLTIGAPVISADGRFVAFGTSARNLAPVDPYSRRSILVRDLANATTENIAQRSDGSVIEGWFTKPSISEDGGVIAFATNAPDLVTGASARLMQAYVWERKTRSFRAVSVTNDRTPQFANSVIVDVDVSADGTVVAFTTAATNLHAAAATGVDQVYVHDLKTEKTELISVASAGRGSSPETVGATRPSLSRDGRFVAFEAISDLTATPAFGVKQIYLRDRSSSETTIVSDSIDHRIGGDRSSSEPTISDDGKTIAFQSGSKNISATTQPAFLQVYVRHVPTQTTALVSATPDSQEPISENDALSPRISGDGNRVSFSTLSSDASPQSSLLPEGRMQTYVRDLRESRTILASTPSGSLAGAMESSALPDVDFTGRNVVFVSDAPNLTSEPTNETRQIFVKNVSPRSEINRIAGADRYAVSAAVSADNFAPGVKVAYVASGEVFSDALSASAATALSRGQFQSGAPLLLTSRESLPAAVQSALARLKPERIVVLGGPASVSAQVEKQLSSISPVSRISGGDRYEVSATIAESFAPSTTIYVASGALYADALSASAVAGRGIISSVGPVVLTGRDALPAAAADVIRRKTPSRIVVAGGPATVPESVFKELEAIAPTTRIGGADRYVVSAGLSASKFQPFVPTVYVASGEVFPDALSGSAAAIKAGAPVLLVQKDGVPAAIDAELKRLKPARIVVLGGPATVSEATFEKLRAYLTP
ncbi:cell wall-binding repeat-containing protein [Herbiconiux sp. P15]|uniref:cell wall-binding repeat-containing protein n=1 Tax=Herbiconiux liukaitaii TaxID=3342799 RepID=UPI0035B77814